MTLALALRALLSFQSQHLAFGLRKFAGDIGAEHRAKRNEKQKDTGGVRNGSIILPPCERVLLVARQPKVG